MEVVYFSMAGPIWLFQTSRTFTLSRPFCSLFFSTNSFSASLMLIFSLFLLFIAAGIRGEFFIRVDDPVLILDHYLVFPGGEKRFLPAVVGGAVIQVDAVVLHLHLQQFLVIRGDEGAAQLGSYLFPETFVVLDGNIVHHHAEAEFLNAAIGHFGRFYFPISIEFGDLFFGR